MPTDIEFPLEDINYRTLTAAQWAELTGRVTRRAHAERDDMIRWALGAIFALPARLMARAYDRAGVWRQSYAIARQRRRAVLELDSLADSDLKDIGLRRCEIHSAVYRVDSNSIR